MELSNEQKIEELLTRSVAQILPSKEAFKERLLGGGPLRVYIGADATGPQLHLGHATNFILLEKLRRLGHEVIVLLGDFTAMLGDPTDKSAARIQLTKAQVEGNIGTWKAQIEKILDFDDKQNPAKILRNSQWLAPLDFSKIIEISSHFTVRRMLERDMFEKRMKDEKPIYLHEFFYPLMQGYDSVAMEVDVEIGGTDQTFNMLAGRTLLRQYKNREKFVVATTLLENPVTGKKLMSKSEGDYIALNDAPNDMFGKTVALPDGVILQMFTDCTFVPMEEIQKISVDLDRGTNPRDAKLRLAKEIVSLYHGAEAGAAAEQYFIETFSKGQVPTEMPSVTVTEGMVFTELLVAAGVATSKGDARRKIEQGGVSINEEKLEDFTTLVSKEHAGAVVKVGKKDFFRIVF